MILACYHISYFKKPSIWNYPPEPLIGYENTFEYQFKVELFHWTNLLFKICNNYTGFLWFELWKCFSDYDTYKDENFMYIYRIYNSFNDHIKAAIIDLPFNGLED